MNKINLANYTLGILTGCLVTRAIWTCPSYGSLLSVSGVIIVLMLFILLNMVGRR